MTRKAIEKESVVKVRTYGALMGALLTISSVEAAEAATCTCLDKSPQQAATVRHAPARSVRRSYGADAEYAQSHYDYRSSSRVSEVFVGRPAEREDDGWRVAPNDAHIRFHRDERVVYAPAAVYPPPYPPVYYYPAPAPGVALDERGLYGGVGYGGMPGGGGGGGGYGGQAFLYGGQTGGQDAPPNGGGVNLPGGYGPTYRGVWQGPVIPTQGGGAGIRK